MSDAPDEGVRPQNVQVRLDSPAAGGQVRGLAARARRAPLGILLLASGLTMVGVGSLAAALYLAVIDGTMTPWALALATAIAPIAVYLGYQLVCLRRRAWLAAVSSTALLLGSSLVRFMGDGKVPGAGGLEIVAEVCALAYLMRPRVRRNFAAERAAASQSPAGS